MILSTADSLIRLQYMIADLFTRVKTATQYKARMDARKLNPTNPMVIELGAVDDEDLVIIQDYIRAGAVRAFEILTFLVDDVDNPLLVDKVDIDADSEDAILYTFNYKEWMTDNVPTMVNERIVPVIVEYSLREWYKMNGMIEDAKLRDAEYENAKIDLRQAARLRKTAASRPIQILP